MFMLWLDSLLVRLGMVLILVMALLVLLQVWPGFRFDMVIGFVFCFLTVFELV